jgi:hypothetical protein
MDDHEGRHCISCGAPLDWEETLCPGCGVVNRRELSTKADPYRKSFRFLWWTYLVRGTDSDFVEVESAFGLRTIYSLGRWILINVLGVTIITAFLIVFLVTWARTLDLFVFSLAMLYAILDAAFIGRFVWSMTLPKKKR